MLKPQTDADLDAIGALSERAFGPGRYARSAYRLREGVPAEPALSYVAWVGSLLVGANQMTAIRCGDAPALLLGPLTVDPAFRSGGIGEALVVRSLEAAREGGAHAGAAGRGFSVLFARRVPHGAGGQAGVFAGPSIRRGCCITSWSPAPSRPPAARSGASGRSNDRRESSSKKRPSADMACANVADDRPRIWGMSAIARIGLSAIGDVHIAGSRCL